MNIDQRVRQIKVIIVDDDKTRKDTYLAFFNSLKSYKEQDTEILPGLAFVPVFCSDFATAKIELTNPGLAICMRDVMLTPKWSSLDVAALTSTILSMELPLILVSAFFEKTALPELRSIVRQMNSFPPLLRWVDIKAIADGQSASETFAIFDYFVNLLLNTDTVFALADDQPLSIMQITDLHFGNTTFLAGQAKAIKNAMAELPLPSFLAITGDVANSGMPSEYEKAFKTIEQFLDQDLLGKGTNLPSRRVLMTPGNHDFCRGLSMAGGITIGEKSPTKSATSKAEFSLDLCVDNPRIEELGIFGLKPFSDFAARVSSGVKPFAPNSAYRYISDYSNVGLHFIELNVEAFQIPGTAKQLVSLEDYQNSLVALLGELKNAPPGDCLVFLAHRRDLQDSTLWQKNFDSVLCPLAREYPVVLLTGHVHVFAQNLEGNDRSWLSISGSCLGDHANVESGSRPSVLHISLGRSGKKVTSVTVNLLEQAGDEWVAKPQRVNKCEYSSSGKPSWS